MPSKRELLEKDSPHNGVHWSEFQWKRILAFIGGAAITVLYVWADPFRILPDWAAAAIPSIPAGLLLYSFTTQSWQTSVKISIGAAIGIGLGAYF